MWVPISSTNTNRPGSMRQTSMCHSLLKNSFRSAAPLNLLPAPTEASYPLDKLLLPSPKPPTPQTGTRPSGSE